MATTSTDRAHPLFARCYAALSRKMEAAGEGLLRDELLGGAQGRVVEVGAGNGLNFAHYPDGVDEVIAVEPEPYLRGLAGAAAAKAGVHVVVVTGRADQVPLPAASVDVGVLSLVMCSVESPAAALAELHRVLRPEGELRFFEHVLADTPGMQRLQRFADATLWPRLAGGCHTARDTVAAIREGGFEVTSLRRLRFPDTRVPNPAAPHVLGVARRR